VKIVSHFLLLIIILWMAISCRPVALAPLIMEHPEQKIGSLGPIIFDYDASSIPASWINDFKIEPEVALNFHTSKDKVEIRPDLFFLPDQEYELSLEVINRESRVNSERKNYSWSFKIHPVCLLYLGSISHSPEIWRYCLDDQLKVQISHTEGRINDFDPSYDGKWIVYTVLNDRGGSDIWMMDRDGKFPKRIYVGDICLCTQVKFIPGDQLITFVKMPKNSDAASQALEIFLLDLSTLQVTAINNKDTVMKPQLFETFYDDSMITFFDPVSSYIWVYDIDKGLTLNFPSGEGLGGSWNRVDGTFNYSRMVYWGGIPYGEVIQYDPISRKNEILFGGKNELNEYFYPQWRPQNDFLATAYRPIEGSASKQIILLSKGSSKPVIEVTTDQSYTYGNFSWSYDGQLIAYQRHQLGKSSALPEVGLWRINDQSHFILSNNASSPKWMP